MFAKEISKPGGLEVEVTAFYHDLAPEENVVFKQQREGGNQQDRVECCILSLKEQNFVQEHSMGQDERANSAVTTS